MKVSALLAVAAVLATTTAQAMPPRPLDRTQAFAATQIVPVNYLDNLSRCVQSVTNFARRSGPLEPVLIDLGIIGCAMNGWPRTR